MLPCHYEQLCYLSISDISLQFRPFRWYVGTCVATALFCTYILAVMKPMKMPVKWIYAPKIKSVGRSAAETDQITVVFGCLFFLRKGVTRMRTPVGVFRTTISRTWNPSRLDYYYVCNDTRYRVITLDRCIVDNDGLTMNNNTYSFNCDKFLYKLIAVFGTDTECTRVSPYRRLLVIVTTIHTIR